MVLLGPVPRHAWAQDQVEILDDAMVPVKWPAGEPAPNPRLLTYAKAKTLIANTLQDAYGPTPAFVDDPNFYCIIHAVVWKQPDSATAKPEIDFKRWYVFRGGPKGSQLDLEGTRIYGSKRVAVLAVHWTQSVEMPTPERLNAIATAQATLTGGDRAQILQELRDQIAHLNMTRFSDSKGKPLVVRGGTVYVEGFPPDLPVTYRMEVTSKLPAPWAHLQQLLAGITQAGGKETLANLPLMIWSGRVFNVQFVPSDILVRLLLDKTLTEADNKTFDDEGNYRWDVSAGIPVKSVKQIEYDLTGGTATPKTVDKYNVFGLFNWFAFKPVDVKTNYTPWPPSFVFGVGLTGKPWERPMVGLGFGIGKVAGFIGANWNRVHDQPVIEDGKTVLRPQWDATPKLVYGVNITAKQLADLLKPKK